MSIREFLLDLIDRQFAYIWIVRNCLGSLEECGIQPDTFELNREASGYDFAISKCTQYFEDMISDLGSLDFILNSTTEYIITSRLADYLMGD